MESCADQKIVKPTQGQVVVKSPYRNNMELFDKPDSFSDMQFMVPGMERPLRLHKDIMAAASNVVYRLLSPRCSRGSDNGAAVEEWQFCVSRDVDRDALMKAIRFCYGDTITVGTKCGECCAVVVALCRLQVTCLEETVEKFALFAMEEAKKNVNFGVEILNDMHNYPEFRSEYVRMFCKQIATVVFTKTNVVDCFENVVTNCLMKLPPEYLDVGEYGDPHTQYSEFSLRAQYVKEHDETLGRDEKEAIMKKCEWKHLCGAELEQLRKLDAVKHEALLEVSSEVLKVTEKEKSKYQTLSLSLHRKTCLSNHAFGHVEMIVSQVNCFIWRLFS